jgi:hypothetical protein
MPPIKELALEFIRPHLAQITVPQFTVMPDTNPARKSPLRVTIPSTSPWQVERPKAKEATWVARLLVSKGPIWRKLAGRYSSNSSILGIRLGQIC